MDRHPTLHAQTLVDAEPDLCPLCGLRHMPEPAAALAPVRDDLLDKATLELLRITANAWAPLAADTGYAPMPLDTRVKIVQLRNDFAALSSKGRFVSAENQEWFSLPQRWRMALLLLCGVDGESMAELSSREFVEMPPPERQAIKSELRLAKRLFSRLVALTSKW
ncbi:hypothetical protein DZC30_05105 [Comamonas testosteroni]|uniref:Uncharacterized protein n=1 Tax=Comamonas testosteroni TaxID=285 RepID=A0A373FPS6_COMTE|nr:hypothetical protein [Comamonas testosteroni]RGE46148.1 hypothetical protein DZC30_05105 [Comamonas testosteroni]